VAAANVPGFPWSQETVPVYPVPDVTVVTGVAPVTGAVTPAMAVAEMVVFVVGKVADITPELAELVTGLAPETVNWFVDTPYNVYPDLAVRVIVAMYCVFEANVEGLPDQATVPVYSAVWVTTVTGVAPVTGAVTPATAVPTIVVAVAGNTAVTTPELAELVTGLAPETVN
jgi:hypothetical protein